MRPAGKKVRLALVLGLLSTLLALAGGESAAQGPNRAGLVVSFGDGRVAALCVEFAEAEITGIDLLQRSGLSLVLAGGPGGSAVCKIEDVGCDNPSDCFCSCHGADCRYWAYYQLKGGAWNYSNVGASLRTLRAGDVDGWAWGAGRPGHGAEPPLLTFEQVCLPPTVAPPPATAPPADTPPPPPATTTPADGSGDLPSASTPAVTGTPAPKPTAEPMATRARAGATVTRTVGGQETPTAGNDDGGPGVPVGLAGFALVAVTLGSAAFLLWRRSRG